MGRAPPTSVRQLADETGMSSETAELAADMADAVSRSAEMNDSLQSAVDAGCLHAAARALGARSASDQRFEHHDGREMATGLSRRKPKPNPNWNPQVGHNRTDNGGAEMSISKAASITPVSLRKHSREAAAIYLDSDADMADSRTRERLSRLTLR